jgi:predicted Rossmann fold flavoprotein
LIEVDAAVVGAGAAGLWCAAVAARRGRRVIVLEHSAKLAEKIRISGGGRCNFTNLRTAPEHFVSRDPAFCRSALKGFSAEDFVRLVKRHRIAFHEKHKGQLFCDDSSESIIRMLVVECETGGARLLYPASVVSIAKDSDSFRLETSSGPIKASSVVIATGGLSIPKIGATDFGYRIARQFGLAVVEPRPALVPLTFASVEWQRFAELSGIAAPVLIRSDGSTQSFEEDLLFTHRGLSGPAVLQISTFWEPGNAIVVDLAPGVDLEGNLRARKDDTRQSLGTVLSEMLPRRLAQEWLKARAAELALPFDRKIAEVSNRSLGELARGLKAWRLTPSGSEGFRKAEVTRGGVATGFLDPRTLEARGVPGLFFIGEVVDVTGWLGGYNFQWAWSSAFAAAQVL